MRLLKTSRKNEYQHFNTIEGFCLRLSDMITIDQCDLYQTFRHYNQEQ